MPSNKSPFKKSRSSRRSSNRISKTRTRATCVSELASRSAPLTKELMSKCIKYANPLSTFKKGKEIQVHDRMQKKYSYALSEYPGKHMDPDFDPFFTPAEMLSLGIFEGKYCNDCIFEYPREWFQKALKKNKLSPEQADPSINLFQLKSRMSLQAWIDKGWIPVHKTLDKDPRGWFQWYCRYYLGRRIPEVDHIQIARWKQIKRHYAQVKKHSAKQERPRQRQTLLQWSYDCFV